MANVINMGGSGANIESKTVKSSQTQQTIIPPDGVDGGSPIIINKFVLQSKTVNPSSLPYTITQDSGYNGLSSVTIQKPSSLISDNIVAGKSIFGVSGNASVARGLDLIRYTKVSNSQARFTLNPEQSTLPSLMYGFALKATSVETGQSNYIYKFSLAGQYNFEQQRQQYFQYTPISLKDNESTDCVILTVTLTMEDSKNITVDISGAAGIFGYSTYAASIYGGGYL